ncbi:hypothetical protein PYW07_000379 [Mythimna separata]|uniref:V-type proton ATPase subunit a n=1 Tax=Mythimna separata TaxID=271217 RepID=A0AAD8E0C8_MYTSE|nr:hypothetical protein PYW07_000379 [Mythimna separata]
MGCMLRSDKMTKCAMYLQPETAFEVLSQVGELGCVQFIDLYPDYQLFQRRFVFEVCRYAEMERKLLNVKKEMDSFNIEPFAQKDPPVAKPLKELEDFENTVQKWEVDIQEMNQNETNMLQGYLELSEFLYVLEYVGPILGEVEVKRTEIFKTKGTVEELGSGGRLVIISGVVRRIRSMAFETMLWRLCHGIIFYRQSEQDKILIDPKTRQEVRKVAFLAVCQGRKLSERIQKVCSGFQVNTFPCPSIPKDRKDLAFMLERRIGDLEQVLEKTKFLRCKFLRDVAKNYTTWIGTVRKSKAVYHVLNKFQDENTLIGECWIPDDDLDKVKKLLEDVSEKMESNAPSFLSKIKTKESPPTYHRTNKFTRGFQNLINAYGDSTYRELNPGLYTLVTFPFLFAMMFGDLGHGLILVLFGGWMVVNEKYFDAQGSTNEIWNILYGGRYVVLLMGLFSMFTGFCYNDLFSRAFCITNSYWINYFGIGELAVEENFDLDPTLETRTPYLWGEDPMWKLSKNKIMFENSFKMKASIIVGITHMLFGIALSLFNHTYFGRYYSIILQFIPEFLFLLLMFFWLVVMIFIKWFLYSPKSLDDERNTACAPQILILFIDMVLMSETKPANEGCQIAYMFPSQRLVQIILVLTAVACVPVLLLGTPIYKLVHMRKMRKKAVAKLNDFKRKGDGDPQVLKDLEEDVENNTISVTELMTHQGVHTIEFVLSTISHTASYLRLWALSLAHSQLSEMLWNMILARLSLKVHGYMGAVRLIPIFAIWAFFTLSILVVMEGLSAFLHCLRLHWVEFMSKFYMGGGWPFRPFSFKALLEGDTSRADSGCKKFNLWP